MFLEMNHVNLDFYTSVVNLTICNGCIMCVLNFSSSSSSLIILSNIPSGINRRGCECVVKCFLVFDLVSYIFLLEVKMSLSFKDVVVFDFTDTVW